MRRPGVPVLPGSTGAEAVVITRRRMTGIEPLPSVQDPAFPDSCIVRRAGIRSKRFRVLRVHDDRAGRTLDVVEHLTSEGVPVKGMPVRSFLASECVRVDA